MKNKIINKLWLPYLKDGVHLISGHSAVGKTTFLVIIASELFLEGKNILFLTSENPMKNIAAKFAKNFGVTKSNINDFFIKHPNKITIKHFRFDNTSNKIKSGISAVYEKNKFDVIVIDNGVKVDFDLLRDLSYTFNCPIFQGHQLVRDMTNSIDKIYPSKSFLLANTILSLNIKTTTFWENLKYFFLFWKAKPNRTLKIIKNRYGKESSTDVFIDFQNNKIKL